MSVKMEQLENNKVKLELQITSEKFQDGIQKAYIKMANRFTVPGFRKGKAPRFMVEKYYGEGVFYEEAINLLFPEVYMAAIDETGIEPVSQPEVDIKEFNDDKSLVLLVEVFVKPEVALGKYKGVSVKKVEHNVTAAQVKEELERMRERNGRVVTVEDRAIKKGDTATIDYEGFVDGVPFEGGKGEGHPLEIGSGQFIPGFEDQLIGKKLGEEVDVNVEFPKEYHAEELAGKPALFKVKIHKITMKELPALDDEFAKDVSEFDTLDALKADTKEKLVARAKEQAKAEQEELVLEKVVDGAKVDIPQVMIDERVNQTIEEYNMRLSSQGITMEKYMELTGGSMDDFRAQTAPMAEKQVKTRLVLEAIAKAEAIEATEEDIDAEYTKMAEMYGVEADVVKKAVPADDLKHDVAIRKTVEFLVNEASLTKPRAKKEEATEAPAEADAEKKPAAKKTSTTAKKTTSTTTKKTTTKTAEEGKATTKKAPAKKTAKKEEKAAK
ncbi:MAG: trigger factor [Clostridia bacterium]|nr:trigger factor [Clostridia bacterium]